MISINERGTNCGCVGFGRLELGVHVLQDEPCAHEKDSDIARSTSSLFAELCACFLLSPVLLHVCVVEYYKSRLGIRTELKGFCLSLFGLNKAVCGFLCSARISLSAKALP